MLVIIQEPGKSGKQFVDTITAALKEAKYEGQIRVLCLSEKDPRGLWLKHGDRFREELDAAIAKAPIAEAKEVYLGYTIGKRCPVMIRISDVQREEVSWLWQNRIPRGKLTLFDGDPGVGKSWLTLAVATSVTHGWSLPGDIARKPGKVILMTAEDGLGDTVRPRLEDLGANLELVVALKGLIDEKGQERSLTLADLDILEAAIGEHNPDLVIIDPLVAYVGKADTHKAGEVRGILAPLAALAEKHGCAVVGVRHLNKSNMKALYRGQASIDFLAACRSAFLIGEKPANPEERVICHLKSNLTPKMPSLTFSIKEGQFLWGGVSSLTPEQVLAVPAEDGAKTELEEAKEFLQQLLSDGQMPSTEVKSQAREAGISEATLRRAKRTLGVQVKRVGFGIEGKWFWELPKTLIDDKDAHSNTVSTYGKNGRLSTEEPGWEEI